MSPVRGAEDAALIPVKAGPVPILPPTSIRALLGGPKSSPCWGDNRNHCHNVKAAEQRPGCHSG